jgi:hypothetical protein
MALCSCCIPGMSGMFGDCCAIHGASVPINPISTIASSFDFSRIAVPLLSCDCVFSDRFGVRVEIAKAAASRRTPKWLA